VIGGVPSQRSCSHPLAPLGAGSEPFVRRREATIAYTILDAYPAYALLYRYVDTFCRRRIMNVGGLEVTASVLLVVVVAWVLRVRFGRRRWEPERWAHDMGLELTPRNAGLVRSYLARARRWRLGGAVVGFSAPHAYTAVMASRGLALTLPTPFDFDLFDAVVGYLVGALLAELTLVRPTPQVPSAALAPRRLGGYLSTRVSTALRVAAVVGLVLVALSRVLPASRGIGDDLPGAWLLVAMLLVVLVAVEGLQRYIVGRPQPVVGRDVVDADDAIRAASIHALAGAGLALELIVVSVLLAVIGIVSDIALLRLTLPWLGAACFVLALGSWAYVARPHPRPAARPRTVTT